MGTLFKVGGQISNKLSTTIGILGFVLLIFIWYIITSGTGWVKPQTIPSPESVFLSFFELFQKDNLVGNIIYSIKLNIGGYAKAILFSIPVGFLVALIPFVRSMFSKYIDALRYVPITGLTGVFIAWFGISSGMKINFLAFGIIVYLLPIVVQRVYETEKIHIDTVYTLGANSWQIFKKVYWPSVISKLWVDIRIITAVAWTYIIVAEMVNNEGGVGAMIYSSAKQSRLDKIFAIIVVIIFIGFFQDLLFKWLDKKMFKFKYV
ncbi:MAG: ABC transporter permease subunit [Candidatus Izemoplasmatales bacterium]